MHTFIQVLPDPFVFLMDALVMIFKNINREFLKLIATVKKNHNYFGSRDTVIGHFV